MADTAQRLYVYAGGHLELAARAEHLAPVVEAFLEAGCITPEKRAMRGTQR